MEKFFDRLESLLVRLFAGAARVAERHAYDYDGAAARSGYGITTIKEAVADGELIVHYGGKKKTKPTIRHDDLDDWIKRLPTKPGVAS